MEKFILGYHEPGDEKLMKYSSVEIAESCAEEWLIIEAPTCEEAMEMYPVERAKWEQGQVYNDKIELIQAVIKEALEKDSSGQPVDFKNVIGHVCEKLEELKVA